MGTRALAFLLLALMVVVVAVDAEPVLPEEVYWKTVLPNTPMPDFIRAKLDPEISGDASLKDTPVDSVMKSTYHYTSHRAQELQNRKIKDSIGDSAMDSLLFYRSYKAQDQEPHLPRNLNLSVFFLEKDLRAETQLKMLFSKSKSGSGFLPRNTAEAVPFSSTKLSEILQLFLVDPNSKEAKIMKDTLSICEAPAIKGEAKYCATSLDSMIDFATSRLGTTIVNVHSTKVEKETQQQVYTIEPGLQKISSSNLVACHPLTYMYAVHYCHEVADTSVYAVPLVGEDGTRVQAVVVCHENTSEWDPNHLAFQMLKMKPGSDPICHFNPEGHLIWAKKLDASSSI